MKMQEHNHSRSVGPHHLVEFVVRNEVALLVYLNDGMDISLYPCL